MVWIAISLFYGLLILIFIIFISKNRQISYFISIVAPVAQENKNEKRRKRGVLECYPVGFFSRLKSQDSPDRPG